MINSLVWPFITIVCAGAIVIIAPDLMFDFAFKLFKIAAVLWLAKVTEAWLFPGGHELERPIIVGALVVAMGSTL